MGRKRKLDPEQISQVKSSEGKTYRELAETFGVSVQTIFNIKKGKGVYTPSVLELGGQPVLNAHGEVINVVLPPEDENDIPEVLV